MAKKLAVVPDEAPFDPEEDLLPEAREPMDVFDLAVAMTGVHDAPAVTEGTLTERLDLPEDTVVGLPAETRPVFGEGPTGYESRNPNFTAGGTAYVRVFCPECVQPAFFVVETGTRLTIDDDEKKLQPTFKAKAKVHQCHQQPLSDTAFLEEAPAETVAWTGCSCAECKPRCDTEKDDLGEGEATCTPCRNGEHVVPDEEATDAPD